MKFTDFTNTNICPFYLPYRDGCSRMIDCLNQNNVPLLIFSAGLGNVIEEVIDQQSAMTSNMKIVSNMMKFDEQV